MSRGIIGGIIGYFLGAFGTKENLIELGRISTERRMDKNDYVPPFTGHWINRGDWNNEDWYFYEHKYRLRFVNVVRKKDYYIISIDWFKKEEAVDHIECFDQRDAEMEAECFEIDYAGKDKVILENTRAKYFIYTILKKNEIIIKLTDVEDKEFKRRNRLNNDKNFMALDYIKCLDLEEGLNLLEELNDYYSTYRKIKIEDDVEGGSRIKTNRA